MKWDLAIIGAGISGAAAALAAKQHGARRVLVTDYEDQLGGFTRKLFGSGDFSEEAELMSLAAELPYEFRYRSSVVGFFAGEDDQPHQIMLQSPIGSEEMMADRVLLCSGSLEKPREAHRIPGTRPAGIMTPMMAVDMLNRGYCPGTKVLLAGQGRLAAGAGKLLQASGIPVTGLNTAEWQIVRIAGTGRLSGVLVRNAATGEERMEECDTLVFSDGRIPCTFYLKGGEIERDSHHAIVTDEHGRTNIARVSAAGSCTSRGDDEHRTSAALAREAVAALLNG